MRIHLGQELPHPIRETPMARGKRGRAGVVSRPLLPIPPRTAAGTAVRQCTHGRGQGAALAAVWESFQPR